MKFKVGDRVKIIKKVPDNGEMDIFVGKEGVISDIEHNDYDDGDEQIHIDVNNMENSGDYYWLSDEIVFADIVPKDMFVL